MKNMAPIFLRNSCSWVHTPTVPLFEQPCCNGVTLPETLERIRPCQLEMERAQMMTGCKSTISRKARRRAKANTTTRKEIARPARPTRALQTSTRARTVAELDIGRKTACWRPAGGAYDNSTSNNSNTQKGKSHKKGKGKSKHVDFVETNQPSETASTASYPLQTPSTIEERSCNSNVEPWIMGVTTLQGDKLVQSICFLTRSPVCHVEEDAWQQASS